MVVACSVAMLRGASSHWVSLLWLCKPWDGTDEFTGDKFLSLRIGMQEESGD